jgi:hypothetical protein
MSLKAMLSIWFFVGALLASYGVLILIEGLRDLASETRLSYVLTNLHLQIWWGIGLLLLGSFYLVRFHPGRKL